MVNKNVEDYLQEGIYGQKQNKPEERNMYLTTLRERVEIALTIGQVMQSNVYTEVASRHTLFSIITNPPKRWHCLPTFIKIH